MIRYQGCDLGVELGPVVPILANTVNSNRDVPATTGKARQIGGVYFGNRKADCGRLVATTRLFLGIVDVDEIGVVAEPVKLATLGSGRLKA